MHLRKPALAFVLMSLALAVSSCSSRPWRRTAKCQGYEDCSAKCDAGDGYACATAGTILDNGEYVKRDSKKAEELWKRGCDLAASRACSRLAMAARMRTDGGGEAKDLRRRAFEARKAACERERFIDMCAVLVSDYEDGWDTETKEGRDVAKAEPLKREVSGGLEAECAKGVAEACSDLGWLTKQAPEGQTPNRAAALPHFKRACELDRSFCWGYGDLLEELKDPAARAAIVDACEVDEDGSACFFSNHPQDAELAGKRFEKYRASCEKGHRMSCLELGGRPPDGWPDPRNAEQRKRDWQQANDMLTAECQEGMLDSCERSIATLALDSEGKLSQGRTLLDLALLEEKTCALGSQGACDSLKRAPLLRNVTALYPGRFHSCARHGDGTVSCWGVPTHGATGTADAKNWGPNRVALNGTAEGGVATQSGACARLADGSVQCWGQNPVNDKQEDPVPYNVAELRGAKRLSVSDDGSELCATFDGKTGCYGVVRKLMVEGADEVVPLHLGDIVRKGQKLFWARHEVEKTAFATVPAGSQVDATHRGVCALAPDGTVSCVEVSLNSSPNIPVPAFAAVAGVTDAQQISMVANRACALSKSGTVRCWTLPNTDVKELADIDDAIALENACAVTKRGLVFCWGGRFDVEWGTVEVLRAGSSVVETQ